MNTSKIKWSNYFLIKEARFFLGLIFIFLLISSLLGAFVPVYIGELARNFEETTGFYKTIDKLLFLFIAVYINRVLYQFVILKYILKIIIFVRNECYQKWLLNYEITDEGRGDSEKYPQGEVLARIVNDTDSIRELITSGTFGVFIDLFFIISCMISFIKIHSFIGGVLVVAEISAAAFLFWSSQYMRVVFLAVRKSRGEVYKTVANLVGGVREVFYTRHENYASKKSEVVFSNYLTKILKSNIWDASFYSFAESLYPMLLALVVLIMPFSHKLESAMTLVIVDLIQRSIGPVKDLSGKIANVQRAISGLDRIGEFVVDLNEGHSSSVDSFSEHLSFDEIIVDIKSFTYPKRSSSDKTFTLQNVCFSAKMGELIGIVGMSGCGKSTLLNILAGNIIVSDGELVLKKSERSELCFSEKDIGSVSKYRSQVGIVSQDSHIFSESVAFNICMSKEIPADFETFWGWVCQKIPYIPNNWRIESTDIINQQNLSMGQKQLLAAIRSCYLKKPIVLFDEISSGLDTELEYALRSVVMLVQNKSLTFIVAHRLETIIGSDRIIVMDEGRISDSGSHSELLVSSEVYQEFVLELSHSS